MSFLQALDTAIAITLIYFLLSLVVAAVTEAIAAFFSFRSKTLYDWVVGVTDNQAQLVYNHPLIETLEQLSGTRLRTVRKPSYIPSRTFAIAILDLLQVNSTNITNVITDLQGIPNTNPRYKLAQAILPILDGTARNMYASQTAIASWFDSAMERVSGWYKRRIIWITLSLSLVVSLLANASTIDLVHTLWNDQALRQAFVEQAGATVKAGEESFCQPGQEEPEGGCTNAVEAIESLPLPLGWNLCESTEPETEAPEPEAKTAKDENCVDVSGFGFYEKNLSVPPDVMKAARTHAFGWFITAVLLSFGARFWFDALLKLVNIRLTGQKPKEIGK